jgi:hypothetical protein
MAIGRSVCRPTGQNIRMSRSTLAPPFESVVGKIILSLLEQYSQCIAIE